MYTCKIPYVFRGCPLKKTDSDLIHDGSDSPRSFGRSYFAYADDFLTGFVTSNEAEDLRPPNLSYPRPFVADRQISFLASENRAMLNFLSVEI